MTGLLRRGGKSSISKHDTKHAEGRRAKDTWLKTTTNIILWTGGGLDVQPALSKERRSVVQGSGWVWFSEGYWDRSRWIVSYALSSTEYVISTLSHYIPDWLLLTFLFTIQVPTMCKRWRLDRSIGREGGIEVLWFDWWLTVGCSCDGGW
jgi:hypothetical protein